MHGELNRKYVESNHVFLNCLARVSNTPGNLLEISKVSWKFSG